MFTRFRNLKTALPAVLVGASLLTSAGIMGSTEAEAAPKKGGILKTWLRGGSGWF